MKTHPLIALIALLILPASARAGAALPQVLSPQPSVTDDGWEFRLGLPLWVSGLKGDTGVLGVTIPVDVQFKDIFKLLDMAAAFSFEARKGPWGLQTSGIYMDLSNAAETPGTLITSMNLELKQLMLDAAVSYAVVDNDCASLELLAGARYNHIYNGLTVEQPLVTTFNESSKSWIDPYLGLQGRAKLTNTLTFVGKGDIGGFDIGSNLTWQLYGGLEYQISPSWHLGVGYRYLSVDYASGGFTYDIDTSGPQIELGINF